MGNCSTCIHKDRCVFKRLFDEQLVRLTRALDLARAVNMTTGANPVGGLMYREVLNPNSTQAQIEAAVVVFHGAMVTVAYDMVGTNCLHYIVQP